MRFGRLSSEERLEVARRVEAKGGFRRATTSEVEQIARDVSPGASTGVQPAGPAYAGLVLVSGPRGVRLVPAVRTGILKAIEEMHSGAVRVTRRGPYAASDVVAGMTADEADALRDRLVDVMTAVSLLGQAVEAHHGDCPAGQQRLHIVG